MNEQDSSDWLAPVCITCLYWDEMNNRCQNDSPSEGHCWVNPFDTEERIKFMKSWSRSRR